MDKHVAQQLIKARKIVKRKFESLKSDTNRPQFNIANIYEPITKPLQELVLKISEKCEPRTECKVEDEPEQKYVKLTPKNITPKKERQSVSFLSDNEVFENEPTSFIEHEDYLGTTLKEAEVSSLLNMYGDEYLADLSEPLPKTYIKHMLDEELLEREENRVFDSNFGARHDYLTAKFTIGDSEMNFKGPDIILKSKQYGELLYPASVGIYELLFKKHPIGFKPEDVQIYIDIGLKSNLFRRNYKASEQINGNSSYKYVEIIEPYLRKNGIIKRKKVIKYSREVKGKGLLEFNNKPIEYIYWDDPNELVNRLRLLIASRSAGNSGHGNEIISIIQELRQAGIIK